MANLSQLQGVKNGKTANSYMINKIALKNIEILFDTFDKWEKTRKFFQGHSMDFLYCFTRVGISQDPGI